MTFYYPPAIGTSVVYCLARIPHDKIVDGKVGMQHVDARAGITFGGFLAAIEWARTEARREGENRYVLPCNVGYASNGGAVAHLVSGGNRIGVSPDGSCVPVPRFTSW